MGIFDLFINRKNTLKKHEKRATNVQTSEFDEIQIPERQEEQPHFLSSCKKIPPLNDYEAFYRNGVLYNVSPRNKNIPLYEDRQIAYSARYIILNNIRYDLESAENIQKIIIPQFGENLSGVTHDLSYILKMRVGMENRPHLAVPLAYKVANLMIASPIAWGKKDYYRLVIQLWSVGEIKYGDYLLDELKKRLPYIAAEDEVEYLREKHFDEQTNLGRYLNEDYVHIGFSGAICSDCAPYQNRIYSINGNDKRFPKLPDFIKRNKGLHCSLSVYPIFYYDGLTITQYIYKNNDEVISKEVDAIKYSNRPFVDDRSEYEKQNYENRKLEQEKKADLDTQYYEREYWINKYKEHLEYQNVVDLLGNKAPKSYGGYKRMKKNNTANFQKLKKLLEENGLRIIL